MYRALASQLRILLCDTRYKKDNSLLVAVYPKLEVSGLESINWSSEKSGHISITQTESGSNRVAQMPFEITQFSNGLSVADLQLTKSTLVPIGQWCEQIVTYSPTTLTIKEVIRSVADKGGGAHIDATMSPALRYMRQKTPVGETYAHLFIVALGRFLQALGEKLFSYSGCRVSEDLLKKEHHKYNLGIVAHHEWSDALQP
ncbi:hypothetical protein [Zobellella endophytica]|uniref:hypothetical protein n=1 Tax=Zobellella endophytica TaxID=2116700 RepID=UPI0011B2977B|nr:hypothetical protein [Zobellella endophytica]